MSSAEIEHGYLNLVTIANPAAGASFVCRRLIQNRFKIFGLRFAFTTAIAVANRYVTWSVQSGISYGFEYCCTTAQAAGLTRYYNLVWGLGQLDFLSLDNVMVPWDGSIEMNYFSYLGIYAQNMQAADQFSDITCYFSEWIES
jgi:hypothetical protein